MVIGMIVRHIEGGEGTVISVREDEILVEWDDRSRTWEEQKNLQIVDAQQSRWRWANGLFKY